MSHDQLFASADRAALPAVPRPDRCDAVVVPLHPPRPTGTPAGAPSAADAAILSPVAQIADYLDRRSSPGPTLPPVPVEPDDVLVELPAICPAGQAEELDAVLCQHIEVQLERIARLAPEFEPSTRSVMRSLKLLLKLRG